MYKILIATTNPGKFQEIKSEFADLDLIFVSLKDLKLDKIELDEPYDTLEENALHKAKFFAKKSKLPTITEDTGFFIKALKGEPATRPHRFGKSATDRVNKVLKLMTGVPKNLRQAYFETKACFYNPQNNSYSIFSGKVNGFINDKKTTKPRPGMDYDTIFYYPPFKKTFAEVSKENKGTVSHRGQVINQLKIFLSKQYSFRQILAVGALIVKDRKLYLAKRRDLRPEFNNKWEFPGGCVDGGETIKDGLLREVREETGYNIEPLEQLPYIITKTEKKYNYQVFLLLYMAKIKSGKFKTADNEVAGHGWFSLKQAQKLDFLPANKIVIKENIEILKKYID